MSVIRNFGIAVVLCSVLLQGCATGAVDDSARDPLEPLNRFVYRINKTIEKTVVLPVAWLYLEKAPKPVRNSVQNVLDNLSLPITFANDLLQGEVTRAGNTTGRFVINSTIGLGGVLAPCRKLRAREGHGFQDLPDMP